MRLALAWSVMVLGSIAALIWVATWAASDLMALRKTRKEVAEHWPHRQWAVPESTRADSLDHWSDEYMEGPSAYSLSAALLLRDPPKAKP